MYLFISLALCWLFKWESKSAFEATSQSFFCILFWFGLSGFIALGYDIIYLLAAIFWVVCTEMPLVNFNDFLIFNHFDLNGKFISTAKICYWQNHGLTANDDDTLIFDLGECLKNHKSHQQPYFLHSASGNFYFALSPKIMLYSEGLCIQCNSACGVCFRWTTESCIIHVMNPVIMYYVNILWQL